MTILLSPHAATVYAYILTACKLGERVPTITALANAVPVSFTSINYSLHILTEKGLLIRQYTEKPPIIRMYYLMKIEPYQVKQPRFKAPPRPVDIVASTDPWEMARECGY